jgi:tetratricopeptide (TPR) repeat protein
MRLFVDRHVNWIGWVAACAIITVLFWSDLSTLYHLEAGGASLAKAEAFLAGHPHEFTPFLDRALLHLVRATEVSPRNGYAYRRLGQAWLLAGNNQAARDALAQAAALRPDHPLVQIELGVAYDGLGQVEDALAQYERGGYGPAVEAAIVNYIKVADWQADAGAGDYALEILRTKVLHLDPNNLPAMVRMIRIYENTSEQAASEFAQPLRDRLQAMSDEEIVLPTEPRLASYVERAVVALVQEGIWSQDRADRVLAR